MQILSKSFDNRIKAHNILTEMPISEYLEIARNTEMLNVVTKVYIFSYSSPIKGENVNIS
ncbi:hypothetical protein H5968_07090 [Sphaerospermopsis sp. LEGE 00249]|uniref:hypothetical protein n=1 Tax=Sphaerospermopsis sp. LEGE 00249 TaxID=1380707 RepID=UPI00164EC0C9|nr:hypothetical protein [Sphaerospermopsis sp. LEGE 00249]MBC5794919.1 hypothetical protein [Sphaerospermopsis sp. LEGE 00249]